MAKTKPPDDDPIVFYHAGGKNDHGVICSPGWYYCIDGAMCGQRFIENKGYKFRAQAYHALIRHHERDTWRAIWDAAWKHMPYRIKVTKEQAWVMLPEVNLTVPEVIRGLAKGVIKRYADGNYYQLVTDFHELHFGQQICLTRLLHYVTKRRGIGVVHAHNTVWNNWHRGSKPKEPWRQKLLIELAGEKGRDLAWKLLEQSGFDLKRLKYHR